MLFLLFASTLLLGSAFVRIPYKNNYANSRTWLNSVTPGKEEELANMVQAIMTAVDEGREDDLVKAGLKVTKRSELERMRENLNNAQILEEVLGSMTGSEEREIMNLLESTEKGMGALRFDQTPNDGMAGLDAELLAEFRAEAKKATMNIEAGRREFFGEAVGTPGGVDQLLSPVPSRVDTPLHSMSGNPLEQEIDPSELIESTPELVSSQPLANKAFIEAEVGLSDDDGSRVLAQQTFTQLLKATMDNQEDRAAVTEEATMKQTLEAVSSGDYSSLDVKSLLGDTLGTLAEQMGIDVRSELGGGQSQKDMQAIMASSMAELASNMAELDEQSQLLYQKLGNLEEELRKETEAFDAQKSSELEDLLGRQALLQNGIDSSRDRVEATSKQLEKLMSDLDEKADLLT